jgi:hypothetical protein
MKPVWKRFAPMLLLLAAMIFMALPAVFAFAGT